MAINFPDSPTNGQVFTSGTSSWTYDGVKWNLNTNTTTSNDSMPVGSIMWYSTTSTPPGWIPANGAAVSRTTYATLFSLIGTTYGVGDGSTTFNVPDVASTTGKYFIRYTTSVGTVTTTSLATSPVGTMLDWPITSSYPTGFLRADGSAVSRTSYADLFSLIGTTYGVGDNSTTFNLPNLVAAGSGSPVKIIKASLGGTVEPSTVAHASSHIRGGSDIIDGDRVQVDYVPSYYTRNSGATGAGAVTDITAHLAGIDANFLAVKRIGFQERLTSYAVNASSVGAAADIFTNDITWTANGGTYFIKAYFPFAETGQTANSWLNIHLVNGAGTSISSLGYVGYGDGTRGAVSVCSFDYFYTPTAGSVSINCRAYFNTSAGVLNAANNYLAVYGPILT